MTLRLNGATSGFTEIDAPAVAGSNTLVLPGGNGSADQVISTNGSGALSFVDRGRMVLETAKTATGTAVDFTSIPSWVKRVTVMLQGVSTNGTSAIQIQLGDSGGFETTGYSGSASNISTVVSTSNSSTGFKLLDGSVATLVLQGLTQLVLVGSNTWAQSGAIGSSDAARTVLSGGIKSLSDTLTQVRVTTGNGTDTFDAGSINILYEG
jgi:hypothetical protein